MGVPGTRVDTMDDFNRAVAHGLPTAGPYLGEVMLVWFRGPRCRSRQPPVQIRRYSNRCEAARQSGALAIDNGPYIAHH
jgi:hypothetical protein